MYVGEYQLHFTPRLHFVIAMGKLFRFLIKARTIEQTGPCGKFKDQSQEGKNTRRRSPRQKIERRGKAKE